MNKRQVVGRNRRERECGGGHDFFFFFSIRSFSDLQKLDRRLSSEQKEKLDYTKRATHMYRYLSLLSNVKM